MCSMEFVLSSQPRQPRIQTPTLLIERMAWAKLQAYVHMSDSYEINGYAYISHDNGNYFLTSVDDVFITQQVVSEATALASGSAIAKALFVATRDNRSDEMRLQWHSHVSMQAAFSGIDETTINGYAKRGMDWFVSLVTNKGGEVSARVDVYRPVRVATMLNVVVYDSAFDPSMLQQVEQDIADNVIVEPLPARVFKPVPSIIQGEVVVS